MAKIRPRQWGLLATLAFVSVWALVSRGPSVALPRSVGGRPLAAVGDPSDPPVVRMDLLAREGVIASEVRDLFGYRARRPLRSRVRTVPLPPRSELREVTASAAVIETNPVERPPAIPFKYIGLLGPKDRKICVFDSAGKILLAGVGDDVGDGFRVERVKHDAVVIGYVRKEFQDQSKELTMQRR